MARHAVLLAEELLEPRVAQPRPRQVQRPRQAPAVWARPLPMTGLILALVAGAMLFTRCNDCIAQRELRCQSLRQELTQLNRECVQLNLELNGLAAEPNLSQIAARDAFALPTADRLHYQRMEVALPSTDIATATPSMTARSGQAVQGFLARLMPAQPAYAQN